MVSHIPTNHDGTFKWPVRRNFPKTGHRGPPTVRQWTAYGMVDRQMVQKHESFRNKLLTTFFGSICQNFIFIILFRNEKWVLIIL